MAVSRLLWFTKAVGSREVPEQKVKNKIGHKTAKNGSFSGIFSKNPKLLIRILIFRYRNMPPNAKNIEKMGRKNLYIFLISNPPYIFSYYLNKWETAIYIYMCVCIYIYIPHMGPWPWPWALYAWAVWQNSKKSRIHCFWNSSPNMLK